MICDQIRLELGGYVLAGLDEGGCRRVDHHMRSCAACRAELDDLRGLPRLLELVRGDAPQPPAHLRARVLAGAARRRRLRRLAPLAAAALALGILIGAFTGALLLRDGAAGDLRVALASGEGFTVTGEAMLRAEPTGLMVELALEGLPELPGDGVYEAWLASPGGDGPVSIGRFRPAGARTVVRLTADGIVTDYRSIWVTAEPDASDPGHDGPTVVTAPIPAAGDRPGI